MSGTRGRGDGRPTGRSDPWTLQRTVAELHRLADPSRLPGMARYGIETERALGVSVPDLRRLARTIGTNHDLAGELWASGVHEARLLASMVDAADLVTAEQMESWVHDVRSWDVCDQLCLNLFDRTSEAFAIARTWAGREEEFVKRAGFALMACAAVHRKDVGDEPFASFLALVVAAATDERNYVKKGVNWALRQIGKRDSALHRRAIEAAEEIAALDSPAATWIARDALRELESPQVRDRLGLPPRASDRATSSARRRGIATERGAPARAREGRPGTGRRDRPR